MIITIEKHNPAWKNMFLALKDELHILLGEKRVRIEHIGSTSVEGLAAKPVIDIMIGVTDCEPQHTVPLLLNSGYYVYVKAFTAGMPERRFFIRMKEKVKPGTVIENEEELHSSLYQEKTAHIHTVVFGSTFWNRHIAFCQYLRSNKEVRDEYQALKLSLAEKEWTNVFEFNYAKSDFIKHHEAIALEWYFREFKLRKG